jgi:putative sigma-54 modulation protein
VQVTVSSRHTDVPDNLRLVAEEKIGRLDRFLDGMDRAEVHFSQERNPRIAEREICEVTLEGHGHYVRCKVHAPDGFVAIDRAVAKLEHQLHKLKTKLQRQKKGGGRRSVAPPADALLSDTLVLDAPEEEAAAAAEAPAIPKIVKVKRFAPMGMTADEAAQRMDLLGHGFFFFTNLDTGRAAVVYRREDGDIGLIDEDG